MKNLKLLYRETVQLDSKALFFTNDTETSKFFVSDRTCINAYDTLSKQKLYSIDLSNPELGIECEDICIIGLQYIYGEEQLCIALEHGEIVICSTIDQTVESVGLLDNKLVGMLWSPDQEIAMFLTNQDTVVMMTHDLDPLQEIQIHSQEFGEGTFVNVGWGSKETQFQGSTGKYVPTENGHAENPESMDKSSATKIAWRGDGQYFAINSVFDGQRVIKIWNREGELQYTGEKISGLESPFAWKPSGSLLASTQSKVHRHDIVFFELNGLQHGEFTLPFDKDQVLVNDLAWNADSSVLMLVAKTQDGLKSFLQLWYSTNYHWCLKQSIEFDEGLLHASWDNDNPYTLHVLTSSGTYHLYQWAWVVNCNEEIACLSQVSSHEPLNPSNVAVIDGNLLKVTLFKYMTVPPPMCAYQLETKHPINAVCFNSFHATEDCMAVFNNQAELLIFDSNKDGLEAEEAKTKLVCAGGKGFVSKCCPLNFAAKYKFDKSSQQYQWQTLRHFVWVTPKQFIAAASSAEGDQVVCFTLCDDNSTIQCDKSIDCQALIVEITAYLCENDAWVATLQSNAGKVLYLSSSDYVLQQTSSHFKNEIVLGLVCPKMRVCSFTDPATGKKEFGILSLSPQRQLYLNQTLINSECTSFAIHKGFVLLTTSSHKLISVTRNVSINDLMALYAKTTKSVSNLLTVTEIPRSVERGSSIVTVTPDDTKVILQMPRGNLEQIHPRALVLAVLKQALNKSNYKLAFTIMRKHRINMNLIYDHDPNKLENEIGSFISSLESSEQLNIFLSELREEDFTKTMYLQFYSGVIEPASSLLTEKKSKVDRVCNLVLENLSKSDGNKYFLSILTAHVRKSKPEINLALGKVQELKSLPDTEKLVTEALRHLHVMVDERVLYREALATYDLKLALMVAQVSNDDPKEYIPFLNGLRKLEEHYRNYSIDIFLKNYEGALKNLAKCPDKFDECSKLIKDQNLYVQALSCFNRFTPQYKEVSKLYADHLVSKQAYEEAGIVLMRCDLRKRALKCFTESGNWQLALNCASMLQYDPSEYVSLARTIAERLLAKRRFADAASVLFHEAKDEKEAVSVLVKGHKWSDALRIIHLSKQDELIDSLLLPALKELLEAFTSNLENYREKFDLHYSRLLKVRELKKEQLVKAMMGGDGDVDLESDIASEFGSTITSSSQGSSMSRSTARSAKNRRKQERNKFSLREGSRFEEEGLLQALQALVKQTVNLREDVNDLVLHSSLFYMDAETSALQELYQSTLNLFQIASATVWSLPEHDSYASGPQATVNSILATRSPVVRNTMKLIDLEIFLPPKIDSKTRVGMNLYSSR